VAIIVDGVPVFERTGRVNLDLDNIDSIRLVKGGASYLFGDDALSGAIIITTKRGVGNRGVKLDYDAGSFGYSRKLARVGEALGVPTLQALAYREGDFATYEKDKAGVSTYSLPFTLTTAEYVGLIDPMVVSTNEGGELVPIGAHVDAVVRKAINLVTLQRKPNQDKRVALFVWSTPPGEGISPPPTSMCREASNGSRPACRHPATPYHR
jgi:hypothetical protein